MMILQNNGWLFTKSQCFFQNKKGKLLSGANVKQVSLFCCGSDFRTETPSYPETPVGTTWQPTSKPNFVQISLHFLLLFFQSSDWGRFVGQDVGSPGRFWVRKILRKLRWMALDCLNLQANHAPIESTSHHLRQITNCIQTLVDRGACVTWCHCIEKKSLLHLYIHQQSDDWESIAKAPTIHLLHPKFLTWSGMPNVACP